MKKVFLLPLLLLVFAFSEPEKASPLTCPSPANVHIAFQSSDAIAFDWDDCGCTAPVYKVYYVRHSDNYQSPAYTATASGYTFTNLPADTYDFYFYTTCGDTTSGVIGNEEIILG
ncbi:MAG: hypothetical protein HY842_02060 [Bacteroidetes bacterium]|nr:hypothetical protein [Bacteroidota bacterium]